MNRKVFVYSTEKEEVGTYELKIVTTLEDESFQDGLVPNVEYFNVTVVEHPTSTVNYAAYPRVHLAERLSLKVNESVVYELYPEDPDGEDSDVVVEFKVLSDIQRNLCPDCFSWNPKARTLFVAAKEILAD